MKTETLAQQYNPAVHGRSCQTMHVAPHPILGTSQTDDRARHSTTSRRPISPVAIDQLISRRTAPSLLGASALVQTAGCGTNSATSQPGTDPTEFLHYLAEIGRRIESRDVSPIDLTERMSTPPSCRDREMPVRCCSAN
jgi:hypothetical protein